MKWWPPDEMPDWWWGLSAVIVGLSVAKLYFALIYLRFDSLSVAIGGCAFLIALAYGYRRFPRRSLNSGT